jgi:hypothetical protein
MYEVQISDNNVFSDPDTFTVLDTFFAIDGLVATKYVRVRGVRYEGLTGNWSNTAALEPTIVAPTVFTTTFYTEYNKFGESEQTEPDLERSVRYSGEKAPTFYTIFETSYTPTNNTGGMMVFGYVSNRLHKERNSKSRHWDRVRFSVNGITRMEQDFCHWTDASEDPDTPSQTSAGVALGFYGRGGYTASFGPYSIGFPGAQRGIGPKDPKTVVSFYVPSIPNGIGWSSPKTVKRPNRFDQGPLSLLTSTETVDEASTSSLTGINKTQFLACTNFDFNIPDHATITGIEALVKRRQTSESINQIKVDLGNATINKPFTDAGVIGLSESDIVTVDGFSGLMIETDDTTDRLRTALTAVEITDAWTINFWCKILDVPTVGFQRNLFNLDPDTAAAAAALGEIRFLLRRVAAGGTLLDLQIIIVPPGGAVTLTWLETGSIAPELLADGQLHNVTIRRDPTLGSRNCDLYIDGAKMTPTSDVGGLGGVMTDISRVVNLGDGVVPSPIWDLAQVAIFDKALGENEIETIVDSSGGNDLRTNFGNYVSSSNLKHYYLLFLPEGDIVDERVHLVTRIKDAKVIRTDLANKAQPFESWPRLAKFNSDGTSDGIPHDKGIGMGYQSYGGDGDKWGGAWQPADVNHFYFGVSITAKNISTNPARPYIDHVKMKVYFTDALEVNRVRFKVEAEASNNFYVERECFGGAINGVEIGATFYSEFLAGFYQ